MSGNKEKDEGDYLGYGVYADTLWNRIQAALDKDLGSGKALGDDPLVVGIFGEWGAGKSTLLKLVRHRAEAAAEQANNAQENVLTVPVYFQPWKYEHEKHLLVPLVLHVVEAAREALKKSPTVRQQLAVLSKDAEVTTWKWGRRAHESAKTARKWFPVVKKIVGSLSVFGVSIALPDEIDDWLKDAEAVFESPEAKEQQRRATAQELRAKKLSFVDNGFHYYELHELLTALTRPGKTADTEDLTSQGALAKNLRINFVIFIDDLDRCLPEKAVETLELIKTVFNLESFAFVLALDEEVVERGIGHRYKDYALQNKKPEMPITGFEYLEKIVHLPFRLPLLTEQQGLQFLARHESALLDEQANRRWPSEGDAAQVNKRFQWLAQRRWFSADGGRDAGLMHARRLDASEASKELLTGTEAPSATVAIAQHRLHLAHLVLGSFNAHVPRKLIRVVELFNQVQDVLEAMNPPRQLAIGGEWDPRSVLALLLLQLFQPDLYRSLRRSADTFELFFDAFKPLEPSESTRQARVRRQLSASTADADLLHWAVYFIDDQPPGTLRAAQQRIPRLDVAERHATQHKRLPLVERLLEHRSIQRHPFDPLKLMQLLEQSARADKVPLQFDSNLFALLALEAVDSQQIPRELVETKPAPESPGDVKDRAGGLPGVGGLVAADEGAVPGADIAVALAPSRRRNFVEATDVQNVFLTLVAPDEATQKTVARVAGLQGDDLLGSKSAKALRSYLEREFLSAEIAPSDSAAVDRIRRLSIGLIYLAPHLAPEDATFMWNLTKLGTPHWDRAAGFETVEQVGQAAREANLYVALGQDDRFDHSFFFLPKNLHPSHDHKNEPLPGFVWVQRKRADLRPEEGSKISLAPFLMARYLTTVDQFRAFVDGGGYKKSDWWDSQGWAWVTGDWDRHPSTPEWLKDRLGGRPVEERQAPDLWAQQRWRGSHPVGGVNWFEARAYARWLNQQEAFRQRLNEVNLGNTRVELPIEAQWERAARAAGFDSLPDGREYVWNDEKAEVALHANIDDSGLGEASPVGLFPSSPLGICDLNGNLWEWQDNLVKDQAPYAEGQRIPQLKSVSATPESTSDWLVTGKEGWPDSATPALRGGAWVNSAEYARASFRYWYLPGNWLNLVGFRVVLSLAEQNPET